MRTPATARQIQSLFPRAAEKLVLHCLENELPIEEVCQELVISEEDRQKQLLAERDQLLARIAELEAERKQFPPKPSGTPLGRVYHGGYRF